MWFSRSSPSRDIRLPHFVENDKQRELECHNGSLSHIFTCHPTEFPALTPRIHLESRSVYEFRLIILLRLYYANLRMSNIGCMAALHESHRGQRAPNPSGHLRFENLRPPLCNLRREFVRAPLYLNLMKINIIDHGSTPAQSPGLKESTSSVQFLAVLRDVLYFVNK